MSNADLIARLRTIRIDQSESVPRLRHEAADAIKALEARAKALEDALRDLLDDVNVQRACEIWPPTARRCDAARAALRKEETP